MSATRNAMAIRRKAINYTVYPPRFDSDRDACWDVRTVKRARLLAKQLGVGSRLRRNINLTNKPPLPEDWWVERVWEWDGVSFRDITKNTSKGLP
jgi:hypothetical protein